MSEVVAFSVGERNPRNGSRGCVRVLRGHVPLTSFKRAYKIKIPINL